MSTAYTTNSTGSIVPVVIDKYHERYKEYGSNRWHRMTREFGYKHTDGKLYDEYLCEDTGRLITQHFYRI